jgi:signal transduction histidine kinase
MQQTGASFEDRPLTLFHLDLVQNLSLFLFVFCGITPWALLPLPSFPYAVLPYLFALALVAAYARLCANREEVNRARLTLLFGIATIYTLAVLLLQIPWLPYLSIPVMSIVGLLAGYGVSLLLGVVLLTVVGLVNVQAPVYPTWELFFVMLTGFAINWLTLGTLTTAVNWYKVSQDRSDELLTLTREHRAELAQALKSLQISNSLLQKTQQELIVARKQAERARQMKEQFAANISHELRTPLNLILGFSKIMYVSPEVYTDMTWPSTLRHDIYQVFRNSQHLSELIDDILDLSHFEMTGYTLRREPVNMARFLGESAEILANLFRDSPVALLTTIPDELPEIEIDATRIRQVLINLVTNAYRHTAQGYIQIEAKQHPHAIEIVVRDTGEGIPAEKLDHIFDRFYQVDTSLSRAQNGVGIGLTLSKQFVESHGGRISVQSQIGAGSAFHFTLPVTMLSSPVDRSGNPLDHLADNRQRPSLLLLDSDGQMYRTLRRRIDGYHWIRLQDWNEVALQNRIHRPRALIVNMPSDEELPAAAHEIGIPILCCNGRVYLAAGETAPFRKLLLKPIDSAVLTAELDAVGAVSNLLVVDDDRAFTQLVERMTAIIAPSVQVRRAYSIAEGFAMLEKCRPELILADIVMPDGGGIELIEQMRTDQRYIDIPVILLTAGNHEHTYFNRYDTRLTVHHASGLSPDKALRYIGAILAEIGPNPN